MSKVLLPGAFVLISSYCSAQAPTARTENQRVKATSPSTVTVTAGAPKGEEINEDEIYSDTEYQSALKKGQDAYSQKKYQEAVSSLTLAAKRAEKMKVLRNQSKALSSVLGYLGDSYAGLGMYPEAEDTYLKRSSALLEWGGEYESSYAGNFLRLAILHIVQKDWRKAEEYCLRSVETYDKAIQHFKDSDEYKESDIVANDDRGAKAYAMSWLAFAYWKEGKTDQALVTLGDAYRLGTKFHAKDDVLYQIASVATDVCVGSGQLVEGAKWALRAKQHEPKN